MRSSSLLGRRLPKDGESGSWMVVLTDHGIHGMAGIYPLFNPVSGFSNFRPSLRHLAIVGLKGHVATFDWQTGTLHSELQLRETCRDITFVHQKLTLRFG